MSGWNEWNDQRWGRPSASFSRLSDRTRVYRDRERGWIAGVCAGIADHLETEPALVRIVAVICLVFFFLPTLVAYAAFAFVLKPKPAALFSSTAEEQLWRSLRSDPGGVLHGLRERFHALERRLGQAETLVTSDEFDLRRRFRDIDG
jgi:phage shock protein C